MQEPQPPAPRVDPARASSELRHLPLLHYAVAALTFLFASLFLLHVGFGLTMMFKPEIFDDQQRGQMEITGPLFLGVGLAVVTMGWATAAAIAAAGRFIRQRRHHTFCMVVGGVSCMFFPIGTALGVYTLIVLNRDYVKAEFLRDAS